MSAAVMSLGAKVASVIVLEHHDEEGYHRQEIDIDHAVNLVFDSEIPFLNELLGKKTEEIHQIRQEIGDRKAREVFRDILEERLQLESAGCVSVLERLSTKTLIFALLIEEAREICQDEDEQAKLPEHCYPGLQASFELVADAIDSPLVTSDEGKPILLSEEARDLVLKSTASLASHAMLVADRCGALEDGDSDGAT